MIGRVYGKTEKSSGFIDRIKDFWACQKTSPALSWTLKRPTGKRGRSYFSHLVHKGWRTDGGADRKPKFRERRRGGPDLDYRCRQDHPDQHLPECENGSLDPDGKLPLNFEYQFNYKENGGIKSYDTLEGMHRIDYLPLNAEKDGKRWEITSWWS